MNIKEITSIIEESSKNYVKCPSVSAVIEKLHKAFDKEGVAFKCEAKGAEDPESPYAGMSAAQIIEQWNTKGKNSMLLGSLSDSYIGIILSNGDIDEFKKLRGLYESGDVCPQYLDRTPNQVFQGFEDFMASLEAIGGYSYVCREKKLYYTTAAGNTINGRFDCLFKHDSGRYLLIDWKTSGTIDKDNRWSKLLGPLYERDDCNHQHYSIQLSIYKYSLAKLLSIDPSMIDCLIIQLGALNETNNKRFIAHQIADFTQALLDKAIDYSIEIINKDSISKKSLSGNSSSLLNQLNN